MCTMYVAFSMNTYCFIMSHSCTFCSVHVPVITFPCCHIIYPRHHLIWPYEWNTSILLLTSSVCTLLWHCSILRWYYSCLACTCTVSRDFLFPDWVCQVLEFWGSSIASYIMFVYMYNIEITSKMIISQIILSFVLLLV